MQTKEAMQQVSNEAEDEPTPDELVQRALRATVALILYESALALSKLADVVPR